MEALNLLTGATGFVGGHVVEYLFQQSEISKATFRSGAHLKILDLNGVQVIEADLLDHHSLHEAAEGTDTIYNMASPMPGSDTGFGSVNAEGPRSLIEVAQEMGVKTIVHLSTLDVHGFGRSSVDERSPLKPGDEYQASKASAEGVFLEFAKRNPLPRVIVVRAARAVGSRDESLVVPLLRMVKRGKVVVPKGGEMSFSHPKDIAQAMYKAATNTAVPSGVYLVKSFDATAESLARQLATAVGAPAEVRTSGMFSKADLPRYTEQQLAASLKLSPQASWSQMGFAPEYDLRKTCEEVALWYAKEPWVTEPS